MSDAGWIRYKSERVLTNTLSTMRTWSTLPCASLVEYPLAGQIAFVVGAGASLERNETLLPAAAELGWIFCVNASARAVEAAGVQPDVLVARESIDCSPEIAASKAQHVVLDVGAHARCWEAAGDRALWYMPGYPRHYLMQAILGVPPIFGGTSALTAAVALALRWGAREVVLVGCDFAYAADGRSYHRLAPRGASRVYVANMGGALRVHIRSDEVSMEREASSGFAVHARDLNAVELEPWAGIGPRVVSIETLTDQIEWLTDKALEYDAKCTNATEGGARVPGWAEESLAWTIDEGQDAATAHDVLCDRVLPKRILDAERFCALRERLRTDADALDALATVMARGGADALRGLRSLAGLHRGQPFIEQLADHELLDTNLLRPPGVERVRYAYAAWGRAGAKALEVLGDGRDGDRDGGTDRGEAVAHDG